MKLGICFWSIRFLTNIIIIVIKIIIRQLEAACIIGPTISIIHNGYYSKNNVHRRFKLLNLPPALYILMQKAAIVNACRIVSSWQNCE
jgi:hypothetical protein